MQHSIRRQAAARGLLLGLLLLLGCTSSLPAPANPAPQGPPAQSPPKAGLPPAQQVVKDIQPAGRRSVYPLVYRFHTAGPFLPPNGDTVNCQGYYTPLEGAYPGDAEIRRPGMVGAVIKVECDDPAVHVVRYEISWQDNTTDFGPPVEPERIWHNVTHHVPRWDMNPQDGLSIAGLSKYSYWGKAINRVRARVAFSDGVVVESRPEDEPTVRLRPGPGWLPPDSRNFWTVSWEKYEGEFVKRKLGGGTYRRPGPVTVGLRISASGYLYDCMADAKYSVDWGEGAGWEDVTADATRWDSHALPSDANLTMHTFTRPGRHYIQTRVEYWDGELLTVDNLMSFNYIYVYVDDPVPAP